MILPDIRPLTLDDYEQWRGLYQGYADFYHIALTKDGVQTTWSWLIDDGHVCTGLVAEQQGQLVGFAHFRGMPSPLRGQMIGFLDDLFVVPDHRSGGAAAALARSLPACQAEGAHGWRGRWRAAGSAAAVRGMGCAACALRAPQPIRLERNRGQAPASPSRGL